LPHGTGGSGKLLAERRRYSAAKRAPLSDTGIDLDVQAKVARDLRWRPVPELIEDKTGPARGADWSLTTPKETIGRCGMWLFSG
jgi:hypothetical protein